jgi:ribulose kinase
VSIHSSPCQSVESMLITIQKQAENMYSCSRDFTCTHAVETSHVLMQSRLHMYSCSRDFTCTHVSFDRQRTRLALRPLLTNQDKARVENFRHARQRFDARGEVIATFSPGGLIVFLAMSDMTPFLRRGQRRCECFCSNFL